MKKMSCGVIITNGTVILMLHVTKKSHWDIPKGQKEENETNIEAALRELQEESGVILLPEQLIPLGTISYNKEKDLSLFLYYTDILPQKDNMECSSYVNIANQISFPEIDGYKYMTWEEAINNTSKSLSSKLDNIKNMVNLIIQT